MRGVVLLALALAACAPAGERPIAEGLTTSILNASRIARRCGVRDTRLVPTGARHARLMIGRNHPRAGEACLMRWIAGHPKGIDIDRKGRHA